MWRDLVMDFVPVASHWETFSVFDYAEDLGNLSYLLPVPFRLFITFLSPLR